MANENELMMLQAGLENIEMRRRLIEKSYEEISASKKAIQEVQNAKEGDELLFQIGGSNFAYGKVSNRGKVIVALGSDILAEKTADEAVRIMDERLKALENAMKTLDNEARKMLDSAGKKD